MEPKYKKSKILQGCRGFDVDVVYECGVVGLSLFNGVLGKDFVVVGMTAVVLGMTGAVVMHIDGLLSVRLLDDIASHSTGKSILNCLKPPYMFQLKL